MIRKMDAAQLILEDCMEGCKLTAFYCSDSGSGPILFL
jgi:hypothetical protein